MVGVGVGVAVAVAVAVAVVSHIHTHDFSVPALGGGRKCSRWKCEAVSFTPRPALAVESSRPSKDAAIHVEETRGRTQMMVYNALAKTTGLTTEEICEATGLDGSTVRPRLVELDFEGRAERISTNGQPWHPVRNPGVLTRKNKKGLRMTIWRVVL